MRRSKSLASPPDLTNLIQANQESHIVIKTSLRGLFKTYGEVLDVVAHKNLRMRGQAFVSFADPGTAKKAMKEVAGFPLYGKPMVMLFLRSFMRC